LLWEFQRSILFLRDFFHQHLWYAFLKHLQHFFSRFYWFENFLWILSVRLRSVNYGDSSWNWSVILLLLLCIAILFYQAVYHSFLIFHSLTFDTHFFYCWFFLLNCNLLFYCFVIFAFNWCEELNKAILDFSFFLFFVLLL
jgi:hypothetical protein